MNPAPRRGGMGEPYCSETCYNQAGTAITALDLREATGPCMYCNVKVAPFTSSLLRRASKRPGDGAEGSGFHLRGQVAFCCRSCIKKFQDYVSSATECFWCSRDLQQARSVSDQKEQRGLGDPEDLAKVRRVCEKSKLVAHTLIKNAGGVDSSGNWTSVEAFRTIMAAVPMTCDSFWDEEFPKGWADGRPQPHLNLRGADFSGGWFAGNCSSAPMNGVDLRGANLDETHWIGMHMKDADVSGASLRGSISLALCCEGSRFHQADFSNSQIAIIASNRPVDFTNANFTGATFLLSAKTQLTLTGAVMKGCRITPFAKANTKGFTPYEECKAVFLACLDENQRRDIIVDGQGQRGATRHDRRNAGLQIQGTEKKWWQFWRG